MALMPRRNNRSEVPTPALDMTPTQMPRQRPMPGPSRFPQDGDRIDRLAEKERAERIERQKVASVNGAIDWSLCVVPGCGEQLITWGGKLAHGRADRRDSTVELPICYHHAAVVWKKLALAQLDLNEFVDKIIEVNEAVAARTAREQVAAREAFMARQDGDIYFVRLGDLVKVGWTRDLSQRVKSYGASAELLVSYPGTRDDETNLHRQLRPALAKGREWYEDGKIIAAFITEALAKYGEPKQFESLWTQPKRIVAGKRHR